MPSTSFLRSSTLVPALDNTLGAWLMATFLGTVLQGVMYHQAYRYYRLYPKDPMYLKIWVMSEAIVETLTMALMMHASYVYLVRDYSNALMLLERPIWSLAVVPIPGSISAVISQLFFARRVYMIDHRYAVLVITAVLCFFAGAGFFIALSVKGLQSRVLPDIFEFSWMASSGSGLAMIGDFLVTAVLIYVLRKNRTGFKTTDSILDSLITYAISTGLVVW
ncbi:hypothetical protein GY45DRAFT_1437012 [Cubamyces sp. BRFM 1775]|nr:hypothetical protein GY45DRAFT_1437012 [Cubamyces sp. BRFM 1775]